MLAVSFLFVYLYPPIERRGIINLKILSNDKGRIDA